MQIITVIGEDNSGKTTLFQYMLNQLKNSGAEIIIFSRLGQNMLSPLSRHFFPKITN